MPNQLTIVQAANVWKQKKVRYNVDLSGNYGQAAGVAPEVLNLNGATGNYDPDQYWGYQGPKFVSITNLPAGYNCQIVPGADALHPILKVFSSEGVELAAGAYPAALAAELNFFIEAWGADFK
jgi:hypothetical protein